MECFMTHKIPHSDVMCLLGIAKSLGLAPWDATFRPPRNYNTFWVLYGHWFASHRDASDDNYPSMGYELLSKEDMAKKIVEVANGMARAD